MNFVKVAKRIELYLNNKKLSYKKVMNENSIIFESIQVGDQSVIAVVPDSVNIFVRVKTKGDVIVMNMVCKKIEEKYKEVSHITRKNGKIALFKIKIPIDKNTLFTPIFNRIAEKMKRELSPFVLGIITEKPDEFFINQYRVWRSIPPEEQSQMIEDILILKEKYFRTTKTKTSIVRKLNKIKVLLVSKNENIEDKQLLQIIFGEEFTGSFEFYLIDFSALFRAIELNLVKLKLTDFFENFGKGRKNSE